jgi:hypothetical protein
MHACLEDLLSLRDGDSPPRELVGHVGACGPCTQRLGELCLARARLRALPRVAPTRDLWDSIAPPAPARRGLQWAGAGLAAAASVALFVLVQSARIEERPEPVLPQPEAARDIRELQAVSQQLGRLERSVPRRRAIVSAREESAVGMLEAAIASVDGQLAGVDPVAADPAVEDLWRQRVELMESLVQVRFAQGAPTVR